MTTPATRAKFDQADELKHSKDAWKADADDAAHQLARYVAQAITADEARLMMPTLALLVGIYDSTWVGYLQARDRWQLAAQQALDAHKKAIAARVHK